MLGARSAGGAIIIATALLCAACGKSEQPAPQSEAPAAQPTAPQEAAPANEAAGATQPSQPGVKAYVDAEGNLREPTAEEMAAEAAKKPATTTNPAQKPAQKREVLPDGTVGVTIDPSTHESLQACVQADGKVEMKHACDEAKAGKK